VQPETEVLCTRLPVEESPGRDAADVALLANTGLQRVGLDADLVVGFLDLDRTIGPDGKGRQGDKQGRVHRWLS
jgi:hypothetical protein